MKPVIATLTTRLNSVKMLQSRIHLLKSYIDALPPSYLDSIQPENNKPNSNSATHTSLSHPLLRTLLSLTSRLALLTPTITSSAATISPNSSTFGAATLAAENDVTLISLLGALGQNVQSARELGRKFAVVDSSRQNSAGKKGGAKMMPGGFGGFGEMGMGPDETLGGSRFG